MGLFSKRTKPAATKSYTTYQLMPHTSWRPKWTDISTHQATYNALERSVWLYAAIRLRAVNSASVPWHIEQRRGDEWESVEGMTLANIVARPNPSFGWAELIRRAVYMLDLTGDAYFSVVRNGAGEPRELWPLFPDHMEILPGRDGMVESYKYRKQQHTRVIPAADVLHLKYTHPGEPYYGLAPLQAAARAVDIDEEAERWQKTSLQNMGMPPHAIEMQGESISQTEYESVKEWVAEQSGPENARKPWVLANAKISSVAHSAVDLDFTNARKLTREEILAAYSVPPPLVGDYEKATLANIETARQILWREGLIPVLDEIRSQINTQLVEQFGADYRICYDLTNVEALRENLSEKLDEAQKLWSIGVPLSAINQRLELGLDTDEIEGADTGYIPSGVFPVGFDDVADEPEQLGADADTE